MLIFGDRNNRQLSEKIAQVLGEKVNYPEVHIFPDGEMRVRILQNVCDQDIFFIKALSLPVSDNILEFCLTLDALKRSGCRDMFGAVTYLAYSRADHIFRSGEGVPLEVVVKMIEASGLDKILLIDPHSIKTPEIFSIPHITESAIPIFAEEIKKLNFDKKETSVISPDMGGIRRIKELSEILDGVGYAAIEKERDLETGKIKAYKVQGDVRKTCFVVDDIISTGKTVIEGIQVLKDNGAENIYVFATHPVLSGDASLRLQNSTANKVFVTDTIAVPEEKRFEKLEILSVSEIISKRV